jgi:SAM-dependent methyltransferase
MIKDKGYYDAVYKDSVRTAKTYPDDVEKSVYYPLWSKAIDRLVEGGSRNVYDLGCGVGHFEELANRSKKFKVVRAVDFSAVAIEMAKKRNPGMTDTFYVADLMDKSVYDFTDYDTVTMFEVLEHIDDMFVIDNIPKGKKIIFSVPSYDCESHVRYFALIGDVLERYSKAVKIIWTEPFHVSGVGDKKNYIWLVQAEKI